MKNELEIESYGYGDFSQINTIVDKNIYFKDYKYLYDYLGPGYNGNVTNEEGYLRFRIPKNNDWHSFSMNQN